MGASAAGILASALLRRWVWSALAVLFAAGALLAASAVRAREACLLRARVMEGWNAVLESHAQPGSFIRATLREPGCAVKVSVSVAKGFARAGSRVRIEGTVRGDAQTLMIQQAAVSPLPGGSQLLRLRSLAGDLIDRDFGSRAGMVRALLIADSHQIDREVRDNFADAGMVHMLSISGLHVGIVAAAAQLALRAGGLSIPWATVASALLTSLYVLIIGAPASAVRAGAMLLAAATARLLQRPTSIWAVLAVGALIPIAQPERVLSIGYQLSVTGMAGLICAGYLTRKISVAHERGWRGIVLTGVIATVAASVVTAPIIAWHFGRISLIAPITNLVATPVMAVLQPLLFLAVLLGPVTGAASFAADASLPLIAVLEGIARVGSRPDWAAVDVAPSLLTAVLAGLFVAALAAAVVTRRPARFASLSAALFAAMIWAPIANVGSTAGRLEVHLIDVGQGDAVAVRMPDGRWVLFDAGRSWRGGDSGRRDVIPYLLRRGSEVYAFVLSHPHSDHVGGAASVLRWLEPEVFWDAAYVEGNEDYLGALRQAEAAGVAWRRVRPGEKHVMGGAVLEFLAPDSAWTASLADPNEASTVARVSFGSVGILLTGDAEREEEEWLLESGAYRLRSDVLKVGHHGSRTSTTPAFLDAVGPRVALISVGRDNRYGHPNEEVMENLAASGAVILRTDVHGTVVITTDGKSIWADVLGERWQLK